MGDFCADGGPIIAVQMIGGSSHPAPARTDVLAFRAPATAVSAAMARAARSAPIARCCAFTKFSNGEGRMCRGKGGPTNVDQGSAKETKAADAVTSGVTWREAKFSGDFPVW